MKLGIEGRVALVMAGSDGIGLATAQGLHREGAKIAICARDPERLAKASETMPGSLALQADVTSKSDIAAAVERVRHAFGPIEILVNNAGGPRAGALSSLDEADWYAAVELTLMSAVRTTDLVIDDMRTQRWGRIINISSYGVKHQIPGLSLSNSLRPAVLGWAKTLADQVGCDNILVNTVCPGWTRTARMDNILDQRAEKEGLSIDDVQKSITDEIPLGRMGEADEIANLAVFLASDAASYITGTAIQVDGGLVRGMM
ncbi:SDR family oxidoreductase [Pacificimonas sp. ICDLI1SI03]